MMVHNLFSLPDRESQASEGYVVGARKEDLSRLAREDHPHKEITSAKELLQHTQLGSLFVDRVKVVSVSKNDTVAGAFEKIIAHHISSVPVWNTHKHAYTNFLDVIDIVKYVLDQLGDQDKGVPLAKLPLVKGHVDLSANCQDWAAGHLKQGYEPIEWRASVLAGIEWMLKRDAARIPIIDGQGELQTIVTESGIMKFLGKEISRFPQARSTLAQLGLATTVDSVLHSHRAIDAFRLIAQKRVGAVAVVNEKREIVGNISATDLKLIGADGGYAPLLYIPAYLFVRLRDEPTSQITLPVVASPDSTLEEVVTKLLTFKIHQLYVVKGSAGQAGELIGAVDLQSILRVLKVV